MLQRYQIETVKALIRGSRLLIFDNPLLWLPLVDRPRFLKLLRSIRQMGVAIVLCIANIDVALEIADRITILRNGIVVGSKDREDAIRDDLVQLMFGQPEMLNVLRRFGQIGNALITFEQVAIGDRLHNIDITIHAGEIVAIIGGDNVDQRMLAHGIVGIESISNGLFCLGKQRLGQGFRCGTGAKVVLVIFLR